MFCYSSKQHIASKVMQTGRMADVSPLNRALAGNLAHHMEKRGLTQMALAKKCGVAQTTISLYLSPERRNPGKEGKPGSAKLTEVEMLASALEVQAWELLWPLDKKQREVYEKIAASYSALPPSAAQSDEAAEHQTSVPGHTPARKSRARKTEEVNEERG